jgi:adenylate cyclase
VAFAAPRACAGSAFRSHTRSPSLLPLRPLRSLTSVAAWNRTLEARVAEQVAQLGRMSKLSRFLSPKISDLIMSGETDDPLKARRSEATVVYVDLRGFTAFTETTDPGEVMSVLREYRAELGRAITAYDGTIEHFCR